MNVNANNAARRGFTATEVLLAVAIFGMVTAIVMPCLIWIMRYSSSGSQQASFTLMARQSELTITRYIEEGSSVEATSNGVEIYYAASNVFASLQYVDLDNNPLTISNNILRFSPNIAVTGNAKTICSYVGMLPGETMFTNVDLSPRSVRLRYYVGEGTNAQYASLYSSSPGYQGLEVRFSAGPRNQQEFYR